MEQVANFFSHLPVTDPILIFSLVLFVILIAPLALDRLKIPHIIGLILAGVILSENCTGVLKRDVSFDLFGTVGLLYIMFLAGLQMDLADFKKNTKKNVFFGLTTFYVPMILGSVSSFFLLKYLFAHATPDFQTIGNFSFTGYLILASVLIASMYASHTLISYPIVGRFGVTKNSAVNISLGGTMIATTLALVILAFIVAMCKGEVNATFWLQFVISVVVFVLIIGFVYPRIADRFFKRHEDSILQYIFVLAMVFLGGFLAKMASLEPIIGAFMVGLALNRYIPRISPLMNRLDFVGNAIFIPFFLIGVGMLIDVRSVFSSFNSLIAAVVMSAVSTLSKYIAAVITRKTYKMTKEEGLMIFGLSNAQAAATLAAVMIGHGIQIGVDPNGLPVYLLGDEILNGTIVMILVTCTISSFATEKAARKLVTQQDQLDEKLSDEKLADRILIPLYNPDTLNSLMELSILLKVDKSREPLYALTIANKNAAHLTSEEKAKKLLERAAKIASATDNSVRMMTRFDVNVTSGIVETIRENHITEVVMGLHHKNNFADSFLGDKTDNLLKATNQMTLIYHAVQPVSTIKRIVVAVPPRAEFEVGFVKWYDRMKNIAKQIGANVLFYAHKETLDQIQILAQRKKFGVPTQFKELDDWEDFLVLTGEVADNDLFVVISSRKTAMSYNPLFEKLPNYLSKYFNKNSYILLYPDQFDEENPESYKTV
ncbi:MAG: cation:proton antiporter [Paludibacteraceae bacterium]|nr:cation:proton antiporter [Paludibacteraceae bacterium]